MAHSVLFICNMNSVRSPMAAALLRDLTGETVRADSAGVYEGWLDPFVVAVMHEIGISVEDHEPKAMKTLNLAGFDTIIALTQEAAGEAGQLIETSRIELWEIDNPSNERGGREEVLAAYRAVRDELKDKIARRFQEFL